MCLNIMHFDGFLNGYNKFNVGELDVSINVNFLA